MSYLPEVSMDIYILLREIHCFTRLEMNYKQTMSIMDILVV